MLKYLQYTGSKNCDDASFPFRCHLQVPRRPNGEQEIQKIGEHVDGTRSDQYRVPVDATISIK